MFLSTTTSIMRAIYGEKRTYTVPESIAALKKAGYDHADISLWTMSGKGGVIASDNWDCAVAEIAEACAKHSLPVYQTHGNTASGMEWDDPKYDWDHLTKTNLRNIRATKMLGGQWMVVHPMNLPRDPLYNPEKAKKANLAYLAPYIEEAKKVGIGIAIENMVDFRRWRRRYCGGDIFELIDLCDEINDPSVGICLDTGHANLAGVHVGEAIRAIGKRLRATHINDNHANGADEHLFPYFGTVDWKDAMRAFAETGYEGDFAYEAGSQRIPASTRESWLKYTADLGRDLLRLAEKRD